MDFFSYERLFIFCLWIWILSFLYFFNVSFFSSFSTLYLTFFSLLFTIYLNLIYTPNYNSNKYIVIFELLIFLSVIYKHFIIDKKKLINIENAFYSLLLFFIYLIFLKLVLNKTFYEYYFIFLTKKINYNKI